MDTHMYVITGRSPHASQVIDHILTMHNEAAKP